MKQTKNIVMMIALAVVGALTVGCTNDDNMIVDENPAASRTVILTTTIGFEASPAGEGAEGTTRALSIDDTNHKGVKTFEANEMVALIYTKTGGTKAVEKYTIQSTDIHSGGKSADLTFSLTDPKEGISDVIFVYPAAMADEEAADGISMNELQAHQDGTLNTLSSKFDVATATDNMTVSGTTGTLTEHTTLTNPLCIGKFTINDDKGTADKTDDQDVTSSVKQLTISDGSHSYIVDRTPAAGPIYVAMRPIASTATINLTAVTAGTPYKKSVSGKELAANKIYPIKVTMAEDVDRATPLTLEAVTAGAKVTFRFCSVLTGAVKFRTYDTSKPSDYKWTDWDPYTSGTEIMLSKVGDKVQFIGDNTTYYNRISDYSNINCDAECAIYGNIMSLISSTDFATATVLTGDYTFYNLFYGNSKIKNEDSKALVLPATTLTNSCYYQMFRNCTGLKTAPALPATKLAESCYQNMFQDCTGLKTAPALPATSLADWCYGSMFQGCTGLTAAPALPATSLASYCYDAMFSGCTGLTTAPALPATTLADYCYVSMFFGCTGLTMAPALPATSLAYYCYYYMFNGCTGLTAAPALPATTLAQSCYSTMFRGCTGLTIAPALPATTLTNSCYYYMFNGCTKLKSVTCLATNIDATDCLRHWLFEAGTQATGTKTFYINSTLDPDDPKPWTKDSNDGIPSGWTVAKYAAP